MRPIRWIMGTLLLIVALPAAGVSQAPGSPVPSASVAPAPSPSLAPDAWSTTLLPQLGEAAVVVTGVTSGPMGYVAVGRGSCRSGGALADQLRCWGQAWTSPDGQRWSTADARTSGLDVGWYTTGQYDLEPGVDGVAAGPGGYLAYGRAVPKRSGASFPALWRSADGVTWERVVTDVLPRSARLSAILGASDGYLVAGVIHGRIAPRAAIWWSPDGLTWTLADGALGAFAIGAYIDTGEIALSGGPVSLATYPAPAGVMPSLAGGVVAAGSECAPSTDGDVWTDGDCTAVLWRSADGTSWSKANDRLGWNPFSMAVAIGDRLLVHSPSHHTCPASLLRSDDATLWTPVCASPKPGLVALGVVGERFVAVQTVGRGRTSDRLVVWSSADGESWRQEPTSPALPAGSFPYSGHVFIQDAGGRPLLIVAVEYLDGPVAVGSVALLGPPLAPDAPTGHSSPSPALPASPSAVPAIG